MSKLSKNAVLLGLAALLAAAFGLMACGGTTDPACGTGLTKCSQDNQCHECCRDDDCAADEECSDDFECVPACSPEGSDCASDPQICCDGFVCDVFTRECTADCTDAAGCAADHADVAFNDDLECNNGACDFRHCTADGQCIGGTICYNGDCVTIPPCDQIVECTLVPGSAVTQQGTVVSFSAIGYLASGAMAPGASFTLTSSDDTIASVAGLEVTGGATTGEATLTATPTGTGCTTHCTAGVQNYGVVDAADTRVVVINELTGEPVAGASVVLHTSPAVTTVATDALGVAAFAGVAPTTADPLDVTVAHAEYGYVTLVGMETNNLIVHTGKMFDPMMAGGYRGEMDFSKIICGEGHPCEARLGLTGPSIPGNLFNLNLDVLIGELIQTHISLGGTEVDAPLPGGLVIGLNQTWFKQYYNPTGVPGTRVAWGLGGKLDLATIIEIAGPLISGGTENLDVGALVVAILPLFNDFYTSLVPGVEVTPIAKVRDVDDINGDGSDQDFVPNYTAFPALPGGNMVLKVPMNKDDMLRVTVPLIPGSAGAYDYDAVIVVAGALVRDAGLVPLGLGAGVDAQSDEDTPDGCVGTCNAGHTAGTFELAVSDVAGRLPAGQYERVVLALALNISGLMDEESEGGLNLSGQVYFVQNFTSDISLTPFMAPATVDYDPTTRAVTFSGFTGVDYLHMIFSGDGDATWQVLAPNDLASPFTLPDAALVPADRAEGAAVVGIKLVTGVTFQDIPAFDDQNMGDLVSLVKEFVFTTAVVPDTP